MQATWNIKRAIFQCYCGFYCIQRTRIKFDRGLSLITDTDEWLLQSSLTLVHRARDTYCIFLFYLIWFSRRTKRLLLRLLTSCTLRLFHDEPWWETQKCGKVNLSDLSTHFLLQKSSPGNQLSSLLVDSDSFNDWLPKKTCELIAFKHSKDTWTILIIVRVFSMKL